MALVTLGSLRRLSLVCSRPLLAATRNMADDAGAIREAGGAFSKKEKAVEDQYFRQETQRQLKLVKSHLYEEIKQHEAAIQRHKEAIKMHEDQEAKLLGKEPKKEAK